MAPEGHRPPYRKLGPRKAAPVRYPVAQYRTWRESTIVESTAERLQIFGARSDCKPT
jgi:hypothetical protein